ncbi:MAG TPA: alpha/beta hydrolase [Dehalococcoidia bacterium]|jgi:pimeloyl-ACP methyl ester carboxylesterase|nr:alpha/beta hydrolase [Dehalococcoidia bacterium]MDP6272624.1 alpha/beta hydrolase [Dehalococcoidia bacterium]MDP7161808.1 alpha/beta hydrolase [Dehalococcoidia bacterium]MDP7212185.1 alpha/beta hydrolase [Dehalococcoidia bacterium]MDP7515355.1 alpha/beta hydrolase [Dehalococcoidia bacterium]|tara:strand:+ start:1374 stop:2216 length:843 start_codon:yes stop_codon:yes gene_type:complete
MPPQFTANKYAGAATSLAYDAGPNNGPPVVFLHGLGTRRQDWTAVLREFASGNQVFAPDLRGHGDSGRVPGGYRFTQYADDIIPFLREVVGEPAALVGHSLGGVIAAVIAADHPELVATAVAVDPPLFTKRHAGGENPTRYRERFKRAQELAASDMTEIGLFTMLQKRSPNRPAYVTRALARNLVKLDPDVFTLALEGGKQLDFDTDDLVERLARPMLLIQADPENGSAVKEEDAVWAAEKNPLISRLMVAGSAHEVHHSHRDEFVKAVRKFISVDAENG